MLPTKYIKPFSTVSGVLLVLQMCPLFSTSLAAESIDAIRNSLELSKEDRLHQLKTRQAKLALEQARTELQRAKGDFEETKRLFEEKIVTVDELNEARQKYEEASLQYDEAEIELESTRLEFLKDGTLITVVDAIKYRGEEGEVMASVVLRNDSDIGKAKVVMADDKELTDAALRSLLKVDNIVVTLREKEGAIIADPFQRIISELRLGAEVKLEYNLLKKDVEDVTVGIEFLGTEKEYTVFLKKEALQDIPTIASTQYAQQGQLGTKIRYDLTLERLARTEQSFSLFVLNLPSAFGSSFIDPESNARVTQVRFTSEISKQSLDYEVTIPEKLDQNLVDKSISFTVVLTRHADEIYRLKKKYGQKTIPAEEFAKLKGSIADLILIPKGVGKLAILIGNLFMEVHQEEDVGFKFTITNSGTLALRRVTPEVDPPLEWEAVTDPPEIAVIEPGQKMSIAVRATPPEGIAVGEYVIRLKAEGHSGVEVVESAEKDFTIRIAARTNITGTLILVIVLIVLVLGIAVASIKISRR